MSLCHEHNLRAGLAVGGRYGVRVRLKPGDPLANLIGADWSQEHWFPTARDRDAALTDMASRYPFSRRGDEPTLTFERIGDG